MQIDIRFLDFWKPVWSIYDILTIAVIQRLWKTVFYNYFITGDYFMCQWKKIKATWPYVHIMHKGTISGLGLSQKAVM